MLPFFQRKMKGAQWICCSSNIINTDQLQSCADSMIIRVLGYSKRLKYELTCSWCTKPTLGLMQNLLSWTWLNASLQSEIGKTWNLCKQQCLYQQLLPVLLSSIFIYYNNYAAVHLDPCNKVSLVLQCAEIVSNTLLWGKNTHLYFIPNVSIRYAITKAALKEQIKVNLVT